MKPGPLSVSVVMPFRDAFETLGETLSSLTQQTMSAVEFICIDDGSRDGGAALVLQFARADERFSLVPCRGSGLVDALNTGLALARAPLVARMDADDVAAPDRLTRQFALLQAQEELVVVDSQVEIFRTDEPLGGGMARYQTWLDTIETHDDFAREFLVESPVVHPASMFRRRWAERVGGYRDGDFPEDYDLWLRLLRAGARFQKLPERLLRWRDLSTRATRTDPRYRKESFIKLKLEHLGESGLLGPGLAIWGAGPTSRPWRRLLEELGSPPEAIYDIDPKKFGRRLRGVEVRSADELEVGTHRLILVMVGAPGARGLIRAELCRRGFVEGVGFICVA